MLEYSQMLQQICKYFSDNPPFKIGLTDIHVCDFFEKSPVSYVVYELYIRLMLKHPSSYRG